MLKNSKTPKYDTSWVLGPTCELLYVSSHPHLYLKGRNTHFLARGRPGVFTLHLFLPPILYPWPKPLPSSCGCKPGSWSSVAWNADITEQVWSLVFGKEKANGKMKWDCWLPCASSPSGQRATPSRPGRGGEASPAGARWVSVSAGWCVASAWAWGQSPPSAGSPDRRWDTVSWSSRAA